MRGKLTSKLAAMSEQNSEVPTDVPKPDQQPSAPETIKVSNEQTEVPKRKVLFIEQPALGLCGKDSPGKDGINEHE